MQLLGITPKLTDIVFTNLIDQQAEKKGNVPAPTPIARKCQYKPCRKRLAGLVYTCKYCGGRFCEVHRLPEDHNCKNPSLPYSMRLKTGVKYQSAERAPIGTAEKN